MKLGRAVVPAAVTVVLAAFFLYSTGPGGGGADRGDSRDDGPSLYERLIGQYLEGGAHGLFDRLYVCIPQNLKGAWDNPDDPSVDPETRDWVAVHKTRVASMTRLLSFSNYPLHAEHHGAAFGIEVPRMPDDPAVREKQKAFYRVPKNTHPDFVNPERKNPCDRRGDVTQENKLTFRRFERKQK